MTFTFPDFEDPAWKAVYDSYDQRNDDVYYVITMHDGARVMAKIALWWAGADWTGPEFASRLRAELDAVARKS